VLDGVTVAPGQEAAVAAALERELTCSLAGRPLGPGARAGRVSAAPVDLPPGVPARAVGARVGHALARGLER
jgi:hypothetical protein